MTNINEDFLAHYGRLGMKWGRRSSPRSAEHVTVSSLKTKKAHSLSDAELKQAISRMNLEKQYKDLNPKGLSRAHKTVIGALALGTTINGVIAFTKSAAGQSIINMVKNKVNN